MTIKTTALIDGDLISYPVAASCEKCTEDIVIARCDKTMQNILSMSGADNYKLFLTGSNNFRKKINPEYKANRKNTILPKYLNLLRKHLVINWNAEVTDGYEADDALGIEQTISNRTYHSMLLEEQQCFNSTIICSFDKDLDMIPGKHFNWKKGELYEVSEIEGLQSFYRSLLIGDRADNIIGIDQIGKVKAGKLIDHLTIESDMFKVVYDLYKNEERLLMNGQCLWIWQIPNDIWKFPQ